PEWIGSGAVAPRGSGSGRIDSVSKRIKKRSGDSGALRALTNLYFCLGMHEGADAPSYSIRRTGFAGSRSGPSGRFLYHFLAAAEGSKKMMQLRKMKYSFS